MKGKQLLLLLLLVVVLGGAGYLLLERNESSWSGSNTGAGGKVLQFPINDVAQVHVKTTGGDLNLVKKDEQWTVQERANYPANFEQVGGFLRKLWDLKTVQEVKVGPSQMPRLELAEPGQGEGAGTLVEFKDTEGKTIGGVLLGKKHVRSSQPGPMGDMGGFPSGRYVMPVGGKKVSLVSETFEDAVPQPERWLQKDFLKVENPKAITLEGQTEAMRWKLTRESATGEWKLADATTKPVESKPSEPKPAEPAAEAKPADPAAPPDAKPADAKPADAKPADAKPAEQLDPAKVSAFATLFANPSFKDVLAADAKVEETGLDKPATATIETFDGFTYTLKIGKLMNEAYPVQFTIAANLAKERTPGKDEKPEDKTKLDEEFKTTQKRLEDKLATEKKFEGRTYLLEKFTAEPLLKDRSALLTEKKPEPAPGTPPIPGTPPAPGAPPVPVPMITPGALPAPKTSATTPPVSVTTPPISVTTPPVSVTTPPVSVTTPPVSAPPMKPTPGAPGTPTPGAPVPVPPAPTPAKPSPDAPPAPTPPKPSPDAPVPTPVPPAPIPPKPAPDAPAATPPVPVPPPAKPAPPAPASLPPPLPPLPGESPAPKPPAPAPPPPPPAEPAPPAQ